MAKTFIIFVKPLHGTTKWAVQAPPTGTRYNIIGPKSKMTREQLAIDDTALHNTLQCAINHTALHNMVVIVERV